MNFTEIVAELNTLIKRPDRLADIRREVNSAINFFCCDMNATRDVVETQQVLVATEYSQSFALSAFTRFRKFQYLKRAGTREFLAPLEGRKMFTSDCNNADKYYIAGTTVNINMTKLAASLDVGYYQYPPILTDSSPDFWLLDAAWPAVFDRVAAKIFNAIDNAPMAAKHEGYATTAWLSKRKDIERGEGM